MQDQSISQSQIQCVNQYYIPRIRKFVEELVARAGESGWEIHGDLAAAKDPHPDFSQANSAQLNYANKLFLGALRRPECRKRTNHFFRFAFRTFLPGKVMVYVADPGKVGLIQARRNAWITARDEAERQRLAYVSEKGDYYRK